MARIEPPKFEPCYIFHQISILNTIFTHISLFINIVKLNSNKPLKHIITLIHTYYGYQENPNQIKAFCKKIKANFMIFQVISKADDS